MPKRTYDIRVRNTVARSGDAGLFPEIMIPRSTALEWIRLGIKEVITHHSFECFHDTLVEKSASLERSLEAAKAKNRLVKCSLEVLSFRMQYVRVAAGELKEKLIQTITNATLHVPLKEFLETIGLTAARYHSWIKRRPKEVPVV
jgi:hypothetical protein